MMNASAASLSSPSDIVMLPLVSSVTITVTGWMAFSKFVMVCSLPLS
jgi:hypothetical protein